MFVWLNRLYVVSRMSKNMILVPYFACRMTARVFVMAFLSSGVRFSIKGFCVGRLSNIDLRKGYLLVKASMHSWSKSRLKVSDIARRYFSSVGISPFSPPVLHRVIAPAVTPIAFAVSLPLISLEIIAESKAVAKGFVGIFKRAMVDASFFVCCSSSIAHVAVLSIEKVKMDIKKYTINFS